jgi:hypothetical protein
MPPKASRFIVCAVMSLAGFNRICLGFVGVSVDVCGSYGYFFAAFPAADSRANQCQKYNPCLGKGYV